MTNIIEQAKTALKTASNGHLSLAHRKNLLYATNDLGIMGKIYLECAKKVFPIWNTDRETDYLVYEIIEKSEHKLYHNQETNFLALADDNKNYIEDLPTSTFAETQIWATGMTALYLSCFLVIEELEELEEDDDDDDNELIDDHDFDYEDWTPDFYASIAYSGGNPFVKEGNIEKRREFWFWFLDMIAYTIENPNMPLRTLSKIEMAAPKIEQFSRIQTHETEEIREKINKIIQYTLEDLKEAIGNKDWYQVEIIGGNFKSGIGLRSYYYEDENDDRNPFKHTYYYYPDERSVAILMNGLQKIMYNQNPKEGAWFSYQLFFKNDLTYTLQFNYDNILELPTSKRDKGNFVSEWKIYPRSKEFTPEWLQNIVKNNKLKYLKL